MRKPNVTLRCVANNYAADGERIAEFSFPAAHDGRGALPGGLISFRYREGAPPLVSLYRVEGCEVQTAEGAEVQRLRALVADLWWFMENVTDEAPDRQDRFFALRERVRETPAAEVEASAALVAAGYSVRLGNAVISENWGWENTDGRSAWGYPSAARAWEAAADDLREPRMGYGITAHRSAVSVFGAQSAPLTVDGKPQLFPTREAARAEADRLNAAATYHNVHYTADLEPQNWER